jgi:phage protein D
VTVVTSKGKRKREKEKEKEKEKRREKEGEVVRQRFHFQSHLHSNLFGEATELAPKRSKEFRRESARTRVIERACLAERQRDKMIEMQAVDVSIDGGPSVRRSLPSSRWQGTSLR